MKKAATILILLLISAFMLTGCAKCIDKKEESVKVKIVNEYYKPKETRFIGIINYGINNSYRFGYKNTERIFSYGIKRYLYLCDGRSPQPQRFKKSKCMQPLDVNTETGRYLQTVDNEIGQHSPRPQQNFYRGKL